MIYLFIFMPEVLTVKLTEPMNIFYIRHMVVCTIKLNIKKTFLRNKCFVANVYLVNGLQSESKRPTT